VDLDLLRQLSRRAPLGMDIQGLFEYPLEMTWFFNPGQRWSKD
jgi:hypothetical protein